MTVPIADSAAKETVTTVSSVEGEIGELFRKEIARKVKAEPGGEADTDGLTSLVGRVAGRSVDEVEGLISELREVGTFLRAEGERLQRDLTHFARMNQTALASVKIIHDSIGPWKSSVVDKVPLREPRNSVFGLRNGNVSETSS